VSALKVWLLESMQLECIYSNFALLINARLSFQSFCERSSHSCSKFQVTLLMFYKSENCALDSFTVHVHPQFIEVIFNLTRDRLLTGF
jgi:hypothetical protein